MVATFAALLAIHAAPTVAQQPARTAFRLQAALDTVKGARAVVAARGPK